MKENAYVPTPPSVVEDLADRLSRFRPVPQVRLPDAGFLGVEGDLLTELVGYWRTEFSWTGQEAWISAYPWVETELAQVPIRAIVSRAAGARQPPSSPVVLLLHGWPDSVLRFQRLFPLLTDLTYIAPALPGFPFAAAVTGGGLSSVAIADAIAEAMSEFGFARYEVSAGDVGSVLAEAMAVRHSRAVAALHLTDVSQTTSTSTRPLTWTERSVPTQSARPAGSRPTAGTRTNRRPARTRWLPGWATPLPGWRHKSEKS